MPLDPDVATLLKAIHDPGRKQTYQGTPEEARAGFRVLTVDWVTPENVVLVGKVEELTVAGRPARLYRPDGVGPWPTLVYFHGGGWVIGDLDTADQLCRRICRGADTVVLSVGYRLAPEHPFPAAVEDAIAATRWAADRKDDLGGADLLAVGGDSAGANLAAVVAQTMPGELDAQVLICPPVHLLGEYQSRTDNAKGYYLELATMEWLAGHYAGAVEDLDDPRLSPLLGELAGTPRALVVTAEFDPLRDEGEAYVTGLREAGVPTSHVRHDGLTHGFIDMGPMSAAADAAIDDTTRRIRSLLHE